MASPFSIFRKNQKLMLALLTILAMFGFVFLPIVLQNMGGQAATNPVAVKTSRFGDLRQRDVNILQQERRKVVGVLAAVRELAGQPGALAQQDAEQTIGPAKEEDVVNTWLLGRHAQEMGMVVSNDTINTFLKAWTQDAVKPSEFQAAFKRSGLSELQFFDLMREELVAQQLQKMFLVSLAGLTPAERWKYFLRVKQMAAIETVPLPVANYANRIDDPGDEELKAFFEKYKDQYPPPDSPEPGFREPEKVVLEYFKADVAKFTAPSMATEAEIQQRYEKNKSLYDQLEKKPEATKAEGEKKDEKPSTKDTKKLKEAKQPKDSTQPPKKKDSKDTSAVSRPSPFMLTALREEDKPTAKAAPAAKEAKPAEQPPAAAKPSPAVNKPAAPAQETKPAAAASTPAKKPAPAKPGLSDAIKNRIRREIAYERIQKIFEGLRNQMARLPPPKEQV